MLDYIDAYTDTETVRYVEKSDTAQYGATLDPWMADFGRNVFLVNNLPQKANGIPAVQQLLQPPQGYMPVLITRALAAWWKAQQVSVSPVGYPDSEVVKTLLSLTRGMRAFNNNVGWDDGRNEYWSGSGTGFKEDMGLLFVFAAGNTHKVIGEGKIAGIPCYVIEALNAQDPSTLSVTYAAKPWLFRIATNNARDTTAPNGFRRDPFPFLYTPDAKVLVPLLVNNDTKLYIHKRYMQLLPTDTKIPVYPYGRQ